MKQNPALNNILQNIWSFLIDDDVKKKRNKLFFLIILLVSAGISFVAVLTHEPFRDEAQAWEIAKTVPLLNMFDAIKYEGHPILWFLLLKPFAIFGFPYITLNLISWVLTIVSNIILLYKIKLNNIVKFCVIFNPFLLYWLPVVSRNYSLCLLIIVILAFLYPERNNKPISYAIVCALLFSTHVIMFGFGLAIIVVEILDICKLRKEQKSIRLKYVAVGIEFIGLFFLFLQLFNTWNINTDVKLSVSKPIDYLSDLMAGSFDMAVNFIGSTDYTEYFYVYEKMPVDFSFVIGVLFIFSFISIALLVLKHIRTAIFFYLGIGCNVAVQLFVYFPNIQRTCLIFLNLIFIIVVTSYEYKPTKVRKDGKKDINLNVKSIISVFICVTTCISLLISPTTIFIKDYTENFVGSKDGVSLIKSKVPINSTIVCIADGTCATVIPYLDTKYKFYDLYTKNYYTYSEWSLEREKGEIKLLNEFSKYLEFNDIKNGIRLDAIQKIDDYFINEKILFFDKIKTSLSKDFEPNTKTYILLDKTISDLVKYDNSEAKYEFLGATNSDPLFDIVEDFTLYSLII